jgi:cell division septation protein DedD
MAATTRRSRITKMKGSGITFGHFALPVAAVVALGLLFMGIKLFFLTPPNHGAGELARIETPVFSEQPEALDDEPDFMLAGSDPEIIAPERLEISDTEDISFVLAGPLTPSGKKTGSSAGTTERAVATNNTQTRGAAAKTAPPTPTAKASASTAARGAKSKWGVQIGAFVNAGSASTLVTEVKKLGYAASVSKGAASGKTFHRVRVGAGNSREDANRLAAELSAKGYPVSVVPML